jgi:hypothetical protein
MNPPVVPGGGEHLSLDLSSGLFSRKTPILILSLKIR